MQGVEVPEPLLIHYVQGVEAPKQLLCNAGNSDKKYGSMREDASVTVQGNKVKLWDSRPLAVKSTAKV